jgi:translocation protein SEC62
MQQPTPEQIEEIRRQIAADAAKHGMTPEQYIEKLKAQAQQQHQAQMRAQQQQQQQGGGGPPPQQQGQGQPQAIQPGPPNPAAIAVANFLKSQELKNRTVIHDEKRKDMFKVKRAIRALQSPAYEKARTKNPLLPPVTDRATAENTFKLLPLSLLALKVDKIDPSHGHEGHSHAKTKRIKGLWTVRIVQHQDAEDDSYYIWLYEGSQWRMKLYAAGALVAIMAVVLFPLWPFFMRQGVWYISMAMLGLVGLFFAMAIVRLILFVVTMFVAPPGLWLYPNLFEDVGFFDSFRPVWAWQETPEDIKAKKLAKKQKKAAKAAAKAAGVPYKPSKKKGNAAATATSGTASPASTPVAPAQAAAPVQAAPNPTGSEPVAEQESGTVTQRQIRHATVEEVEDE